MLLYKTTKDFYFGEYFNLKKFQCQCKNEYCKAIILDSRLKHAWNDLNTRLAVPLTMTSGHRCASHNVAVKGSDLSQHMAGVAADFLRPDIDVTMFINLAKEAGFTYYKFYEKHVHLDVR